MLSLSGVEWLWHLQNFRAHVVCFTKFSANALSFQINYDFIIYT